MPVGAPLEPDPPLPFEELLAPLVREAREALRRQTPASIYHSLTPEAHGGWERYLLTRLAELAAKAAHSQFQVFRTVSAAFSDPPPTTEGRSDAVYRAFVSHPETRLPRLLGEFPALKRLTDILVANWLSAGARFCERVVADAVGLARAFGHGGPLGPVTGIIAGLSDPHRGGQCAVKASFENGTTVVYKPRSLEPEAHFAWLLEWLNTQSLPYPLRPAHCWDRGEYGWMEHFQAGPCASVEEVRSFYWRAGVLLCLCTLADGVDMHLENLIAAGPHPVLVDLETLWHPQEAAETRAGTAPNAVLRTGFLPATAASDGADYGWSSLARGHPSGGPTSGWTNLNRDDMAWTTSRNSPPRKTHLPEYANQPRFASRFVPDLRAGFRWVHRWLTDSRSTRSEFAGWMQALAECPRRRVLRSSARYRRIRERLTSPQALREPSIPWREWREAETLLPVEIQALEGLDIPYLTQPRAGKNFRIEDLEERLSASSFLEYEKTIERALG